ncbi:hypothetical protein Tco_0335444 [Tanacetum coccineum]
MILISGHSSVLPKGQDSMGYRGQGNINLDSHMFQKISIDQNADLESDVSLEEIKKAVWECGTNKSPGPDGFSLEGGFKRVFLRQWDRFWLMEVPHQNSNFIKDDAVFIGKWDKANVITIVNMLKCFYLASGLKINIQKSKIMGIGSGGRFTLNKAVLSSLPIYLMSIYKTPVGVLRKMESIRRRFFNGADINENKTVKRIPLWYRLLKGYVGDWWSFRHTGKVRSLFYRTTIGYECGNLNINIYILSSSKEGTPSWKFRREQFSKLIEDVKSVIHSVSNDMWIWSLDSSGEFLINSTRLFIDDRLLLAVGAPTRWVLEVPIKINIMAWKGSHARIFFSLVLWGTITTTSRGSGV